MCDSDHERIKLSEINERLDREIAIHEIGKSDTERKKEIIELLHEYNDIKDAAQQVMGALCSIKGIGVKEFHVRYNLPLDS